MVGFRDLVGTGIAPVSKKTAVKTVFFLVPDTIVPDTILLEESLYLLNFTNVVQWNQVIVNLVLLPTLVYYSESLLDYWLLINLDFMFTYHTCYRKY